MKKGVFLFFLVTLFLTAAMSFCQEAIYQDELLNDYMRLEKSITEKINDNSISYEDLKEIQQMKKSLYEENRASIVNRLDILIFLTNTGIEKKSMSKTAEQEKIQFAIDQEEMKKAESLKKTKKIIVGTAIGTAVVMSSLYAYSTIMAKEYYYQYSTAKTSDDAAFYLYSWPIFDTISLASGITAIIASVTAGVLGASF